MLRGLAARTRLACVVAVALAGGGCSRSERMCRRLGAAPGCPARLHELAVAGGTLVYETSDTSELRACRVGFLRDGAFSALTLDGIVEVRPATIGGIAVALATTRWTREPGPSTRWHGTRLVVLRVDGGLHRALEVVTEEVDARRPPIVEQSGTVTFQPDGTIAYRGERRLVHPGTRAVIHASPVVEDYRLSK